LQNVFLMLILRIHFKLSILPQMPKKRKQYLWLPYTSVIEPKDKNLFVEYKGGELEIEWKNIHSIMFYGQCRDFPQKFLEKCAFYKIPVVIHRRNMPRAVFISPTLSPDYEKILFHQILFRENKKKKAYIAKKLLSAKFKSMQWLIEQKQDPLYRITDIDLMLQKEAFHARCYWKKYYQLLNLKEQQRRSPAKDNFTKQCLDAVSKFTSSIILRWILYHNLNPYYGFLHKPTDYPSLVYDLIEPYRGYFDKVVFNSLEEIKKKNEETDQVKIIGYTIEQVKDFLDSEVYVEATRQIATFQELLHGIVLALRTYLLKETKRFVVPLPSSPKKGRPIKSGYLLYGHCAGKTDFWKKAREISYPT